MDELIAGLLTERHYYLRLNRPEKVAQVDAILERFGHRVESPETTAASPPPERAVPPRPQARKRVPHAEHE